MARPRLIIIQGAPASGKTTLSRELIERLENTILLSKDDIKEFLFDTQPAGDREWSKILGRVSIAGMYAMAGGMLQAGRSVMLESAFDSQYARLDIEALGADVIEIFCECDDHTLRKRFERRAATTRHPGHLDDQIEYAPERLAETYRPIGIGSVITLNTTQSIQPAQFEQLVEQLTEFLEGN